MVLGFFTQNQQKLEPFFNQVDNQALARLNAMNNTVNNNQYIYDLARNRLNQGISSLPFQYNNPYNNTGRTNYINNFLNTQEKSLTQPFQDASRFINQQLTNAGLGASSLNVDAQNRLLDDYINKQGELASKASLLYDDVEQNKFNNDLKILQIMQGLVGQGNLDHINTFNDLANIILNQSNLAASADRFNAANATTMIPLLSNAISSLLSI